MRQSTTPRTLIKVFILGIVSLITVTQNIEYMKSHSNPSFKDPENINRDILFNNQSTENLGNDLVVKSFSSSENGVPIAYSSADVKYEGMGIKFHKKPFLQKKIRLIWYLVLTATQK